MSANVIQLRDSAGPGSGYLDAAGENRGDGTAALLVTSGRRGNLVPTGTSEPQQLKVGAGELHSVAAVGATSTATVSAYDAATLAAIAPGNLIWQGVPTNAPAAIDYPFTQGLVLAFSAATDAGIRVVFT